MSANAAEIQCRPLPGIPEVTVRHLFLDQVIPLVLSRREPIVLHASAVQTAHGVIAFAGKSGQGKSTLAVKFAQKGCMLVSDDCLVLRAEHGGWTALPSYPSVRLWPSTAEELLREDTRTAGVAHYTNKCRVSDTDLLPFANGPAPMRKLFILSRRHLSRFHPKTFAGAGIHCSGGIRLQSQHPGRSISPKPVRGGGTVDGGRTGVRNSLSARILFTAGRAGKYS